MRVMIVDDHAGIRNLIRQLVCAPGDSYLECATGEDALRSARDFQADMVTMDVRLPDMGGLEVTRALRAIHPATRVIIVTSHDQPLLRKMAAEAGATGFVSKECLVDLQSVWAGREVPPAQPASGLPGADEAGSAPRTLGANPPSPRVSPAGPPAPSARASQHTVSPQSGGVLRVLMIEDSEIDCELVRRQLIRCGFVPVVRRVANASDVRRALAQETWDIVFTDCRLPRFSGVEALGLIRAAGLRLPSICVTGSQDPVRAAEILEAGACALVNKDDLAALCPAVQRALNRQ